MYNVKNCGCSNVKEKKKMGNVRGATKEQHEEYQRQAAKARHEFHVDRFKTISDSVAALINNSSKFPVAFVIDGIDVDDAIVDVFLSERKKRGFSLGKQDIKWCVEICYYSSWYAKLIDSEFVGEKIRVFKVKDIFVLNIDDWEIETDDNGDSLCKIAQAYVDLADDMWGYARLYCILVDGEVHIFG